MSPRRKIGPKPESLVALGRAIRQLRDERPVPLSQERLALDGGLDRSYVGGVERGERNPSYLNLLKIADGLDVRPSELIALAEALTSKRRSR